MAAFISHSQKDKKTYTTLRAALLGQNVACWDPTEMDAGSSLRDQLREAILRCDVCVFLATKNSVDSDWCMAEVGAFWGSGKRVIVFITDDDLDETHVPPQLQGDLRAEDFDSLVRSAKKVIFEAEEKRRQDAARRPRLVSEMTIATLYDVLASLRTKGLDGMPPGDAMKLIQRSLLGNPADAGAVIPQLVAYLLGVSQTMIEETAARDWPVAFDLTTDTGDWRGFAMAPIDSALLDGYSNCLLILFEENHCIAAAAASAVVQRDKKISCEGVVAHTGSQLLGSAVRFAAKKDTP